MADKILGVDLDGVLSDFNSAYMELVPKVTGRSIPLDPTTWYYPQAAGYTDAEIDLVWEAIKEDPNFWFTLPPYNDAEAAMFYLRKQYIKGADIYFITTRVGVDVKLQSTKWLDQFNAYLGGGVPHPTVIITDEKGLIARGLKLTHFIDDKPSNCERVRDACPSAKVFLMDRPWNREREIYGVSRVEKLEGFADVST